MGPTNQGGGVALKYARVEEACRPDFKGERIGSIDEIEPDDIVLVDWMWFRMTSEGEKTTPVDRVKSFVELPNLKLIYGSEFCVSTLPGQLINLAAESADIILHNSNHLRNLYQTIGIYNSSFLSDPVPPIFSPSISKKPRVIAMGQISKAKNTSAAATVFEGLNDTDVERVFIGGRSLWGKDMSDRGSLRAQADIEEVSDIFVENAPQARVAELCNDATYYIHFAYHDVSSFAGQENMSSGNIVFGLGHPILKERTAYRFNSPQEIVESIKNYAIDSEAYQVDLGKTLEIASRWSYNAWRGQMYNILRKLQ